MIVLGVETSCDETAVAIVADGRHVLADVVYSQMDIHEKYGGVVPEVASRKHVQKIIYVFDQALKQAKITAKEIDLVAVTTHPGLIGSLLVGLNAARAFALVHKKPIVFVNHLTGHIYANHVETDFEFPVIALVVSGGHTEIILMKKHYDFKMLGQTFDDAIGEAYDKVGRVMGLAYPGGVYVDRLAQEGNNTISLPVYKDETNYNFSFSGIKSAVLNVINQHSMKNQELNKADLACSFQETVTDVLVSKTISAAKEFKAKQIVVAGGVAANKGLRNKMTKAVNEHPELSLSFPSFKYCTDNAVMIAVSGYFQYQMEQSKDKKK